MAGNDAGTNDAVIDGAEPFNPNGDDVGGSGNGASGSDAGIDPTTLVAADAPKRGRGRPRKDGSTNAGGGETAQGGKSGGQTGGQSSSSNLDVEIFATQLQGFHAILAKLSKNDLWNITKDEAVKLAKSIKEVMKLHKITIPSKYMVYGNLFAVSMAIYGPRLAIMAIQQKAKKDADANTFNTDGSPVAP